MRQRWISQQGREGKEDSDGKKKGNLTKFGCNRDKILKKTTSCYRLDFVPVVKNFDSRLLTVSLTFLSM